MVKHNKLISSPSLAISFLSFLLPLLCINNSSAQEWGQVCTQAEMNILIGKLKNSKQHGSRLESPERYSKIVVASLKAFKDEKWNVSSWIAIVLGSIGPEAEDIVLALIEALKDEEGEIRSRAAHILGSISGEATEEAVPALIQALKDKEWQVRSGATYALGSIGSEAKVTICAIIRALIEALKDEEWQVRRRAASALEGMGTKAKKAVPTLVETLKDKEENVRIHTALALGSMGSEAEEAVPALIETLKDKGWYVRSFTADALVQIAEALVEKKDTELIPQLQIILEALEENEAEFAARIRAVRRTLEAFNSLS